MAALSFGHLPAIFVPAGPMASGLPNKEKVRIRQLYAEGKVDRQALLEAEAASYHSAGTCTFYGTANSNQMVMEVMGLHLPGASFIQPNTPLRDALTAAAARQITRLTETGINCIDGNHIDVNHINSSHINSSYLPVGQLVDEKVVVNGIVALLATGGSTNHTLHWSRWRGRRASSLIGMISLNCRKRCRSYAVFTLMAQRTSTIFRHRVVWHCWLICYCKAVYCTKRCIPSLDLVCSVIRKSLIWRRVNCNGVLGRNSHWMRR